MIKEYVGNINVLSSKDCDSVVDRIDSLRSYWINKSEYTISNGEVGLPPLWSLGAASYRDLKLGRRYYDKIRKLQNNILLENFSDIYLLIIEKISKYIGDVEIEKNLAVPGFHIFGEKTYLSSSLKVNIANNDIVSMIHKDQLYDYHYEYLSKIYHNVEKKIISITISIKLPSRGSGLCTWEDDSLKIFSTEEEFAKDIKKNKVYQDCEFGEPNIIGYKEGSAFCFSGETLHQIAPPCIINPGDRRITMQMHGIVCDNVWRLFL